MSRTILTTLALCALLSAAACTDLTGPGTNNDTRVGQDGGKHRNPNQVASPDEITPPGDGEGGSDGVKDTSGQPGTNPVPRDPGDLSPVQSGGGAAPGHPDEIEP